MFKFITFSIGLTLVCTQLAVAQHSRAQALLGSNNIIAVESEFSSLQRKFEQGEASEYDLLDAYKAFYQREDRYRSQLDNWIKQYPNSASAYLARGVYYRKLGEFKRGSDYISQVPNENVDYMTQMFALAKQDLEMSLRLNPKSYLAILHLLNIAQFQGNKHAANNYLHMGNTALPSNFIVRARYLLHLTPKWGGSYQSMERFIDKSRSQGLSQDKLDLLNAIKFDDQGAMAEEKGNLDLARSEYKRALVLAKFAGQRFRQDYLRSASRICGEVEHQSQKYCH